MTVCFFCFFFSSRRRHTRFKCDWSSDVCSSDLRPTELTDGRVATALNSSGTVVTKVVPASVAGAGAAGLYLGSDYLGYYSGPAWKTYMQNNGNFYLSGTATHGLTWDGATLSIAGDISIKNAATVRTDINVANGATANSSDATLLARTNHTGTQGATSLDTTVISGGKIVTGLLTADNIQAGTLTGRTIQTASSGARILLDSSQNTMRVFADRGDTTIEEISTIGDPTTSLAIGWFGTLYSTRLAVYGVRTHATNPAVYGQNLGTGVGTRGYAASGTGVLGESDSSYGVFG